MPRPIPQPARAAPSASPAPAWSSSRRRIVQVSGVQRSLGGCRSLGARSPGPPTARASRSSGRQLAAEQQLRGADGQLAHPLRRDPGVAQGRLHGKPIQQRGDDRGHVVPVDPGELAEVLAGADDLGDLVAPAVIEPLAGNGRAVILQGPAPELHPQPAVVLGGAGLDQHAEPVARALEPGEALGHGAVEAVLVEGERVGEQVVLRPEPVEDGRRAGPGSLGDIGDPGGGESALADHLSGGSEDLRLADVIDLRARTQRSRPILSPHWLPKIEPPFKLHPRRGRGKCRDVQRSARDAARCTRRPRAVSSV